MRYKNKLGFSGFFIGILRNWEYKRLFKKFKAYCSLTERIYDSSLTKMEFDVPLMKQFFYERIDLDVFEMVNDYFRYVYDDVIILATVETEKLDVLYGKMTVNKKVYRYHIHLFRHEERYKCN